MMETVIEIKEDKRGATVRFDSGEELWFSRALWREQRLCENEETDIDTLKQWLLPRQYTEALNRAVGLLAMRGRCEGELRKKLKLLHYMDDTVEMVLYKLQKEKLINDELFAHDFAASCARKQLGKHRILQELRMKGIGRELAEQVVAELPEEESSEQAVALATKLLRRYGDEEDARKGMQKLLGAMARRGFAYSDAHDAVTEAMRRIEEAAQGEGE